jgi:hypothetical protein
MGGAYNSLVVLDLVTLPSICVLIGVYSVLLIVV